MAKTFDNIWEAAAINFVFLKGQRTFGLAWEPPTPPPLNVLSLPYEALKVGRWMCARIKAGKQPIEPTKESSDRFADRPKQPEPDSPTAAESAEAGKERQAAEDQAAAAEAAAEQALAKQALAAAITEYVADRQADTAQEDRWRTTMQRKMDQGFRELRKEIDGMKMMNQKLDEKLDKLQEQLVEKIVKAMGK